ncbi:MAG: prephenate dehydrogenase/arogenate dehydrogenase family protein, partial [Synechococcus sp.]|nr:prephenate dehydrogenase/arogenate dehydrogenase family protein [Synechococcus sp.]
MSEIDRMDPGQESQPWSIHRVGVVGMGLIGGSIALDLTQQGVEVQGLVHREVTAERARSRGLAPLVSTDPSCLQDCDLVILALPLESLLTPEESLLNALPEQAVVTDVGSVKAEVLAVWRGLHPRFVGSPPLAGTAPAGGGAGLPGLVCGRPLGSTPGAPPGPAPPWG